MCPNGFCYTDELNLLVAAKVEDQPDDKNENWTYRRNPKVTMS